MESPALHFPLPFLPPTSPFETTTCTALALSLKFCSPGKTLFINSGIWVQYVATRKVGSLWDFQFYLSRSLHDSCLTWKFFFSSKKAISSITSVFPCPQIFGRLRKIRNWGTEPSEHFDSRQSSSSSSRVENQISPSGSGNRARVSPCGSSINDVS